MSALLLVLAGFGIGFLVRGLENTNYLAIPVASENEATSQAASELAVRLGEVQVILADEAYSSVDLQTATATDIQALLQATGDTYAKYYTADEYKNYLEKTTGEYAGIGVLLSEYNGAAYVVRVYEDTPAAVAGLKEGDFITTINGETRTSWTLEEVTARITSKEGETVTLGWRRPASLTDAGGDTYSASIQCANIEIPNVSYSLVDGTIGYVSIAQFTTKSTEDVKAAIASLESQGAQGYILDLRGNPGGYVAQAVEISSMFLNTGTVVGINSRTAGTSYKQVTDNYLTDKPVTVLVNENSASASEIVAAALQENNRATIVGTVTFGKGTVQALKELSFGGAIKYTVAHYLTPSGTDIDGVGVTPNIAVDMDTTLRGTADDTQYAAALENIRAQIAGTITAAQPAVIITATSTTGE